MSAIISLCVLWRRQSRNGTTYYEGRLTRDTKMLVFRNQYKQADDNRPDLIVKVAEIEKRSGTTDESPRRAPNPKPLPPEDDVPF